MVRATVGTAKSSVTIRCSSDLLSLATGLRRQMTSLPQSLLDGKPLCLEALHAQTWALL